MVSHTERRLKPLAKAVKSAHVKPALNVAWVIEHERKMREMAKRFEPMDPLDYVINSALE